MDKSKLTRGGAGPTGLPTDTVDITIEGETMAVLVRAMNRGEMLHCGELSDTKGQAVAEQYMLSCAMLDPEMTKADVADWQASGIGMESHPVVMKINELSGAEKGAAKSVVPADGDRSDDGV